MYDVSVDPRFINNMIWRIYWWYILVSQYQFSDQVFSEISSKKTRRNTSKVIKNVDAAELVLCCTEGKLIRKISWCCTRNTIRPGRHAKRVHMPKLNQSEENGITAAILKSTYAYKISDWIFAALCYVETHCLLVVRVYMLIRILVVRVYALVRIVFRSAARVLSTCCPKRYMWWR